MQETKIFGIPVKKFVLFSLLALFGIGLVLMAFACSAPSTSDTGTTQTGATEAQKPPWADQATGVTLEVSKPPGGAFFKTGDKPVITVTLKDATGNSMATSDFDTLALYMYGPQDPTKTVTAAKLLNASTDRTKTPHHYIDLLKNPDVKMSGNVLKYTLQAISNEDPGTYTVGLRISIAGKPLDQYFDLVDTQVGTADIEKQIVAKDNCAACHEGADNGVFYMHHVDPGHSPVGSPSIDYYPVTSCKACHNNDGYAAYSGNILDPTAPTSVKTPDPIIRRVHGVHMGAGLENPFNTDPKTGNFKDYTNLEFPADVKDCTKCHVDDRWKTQPSRLACGACHDNIWFGTTASMPSTAEAHPGGPQANDSACAGCHPADSGGIKAVAEAHKINPPAFKDTVDLQLSSPANGKYYVSGEKPTVTITLKDAATGAVIDPNTIVEPQDNSKVQPNEWRRANLFVSGPRDHTKPVLTTAASVNDPAQYYAENDFRVRVKKSDEDPRITRSSTAITYQLDDVAGLKAGTYTAFVEVMPAAPLGGWGVVNFQVGTATEEPMIATNCSDCHEDTRMHGSYFAVKFNPDICKSCHDYERQSPGKVGWSNANNGFGAAPLARRVHGVHFGHYLDKPDEVHAVTSDFNAADIIFPQDVRNCTKCHGDNPMWKEEPSRLACNACHDSDAAISHTSLMTEDPTPQDPWSGDETETCDVCHGAGKDFSPDKVHNITNPYVPPYLRQPGAE